MSHMVVMDMPEIKDLDILSKACKRLGLTLDVNKKQASYYAGQNMKCDAVISAGKSASYEIALVKKGNSYEVQADLFDTRLQNMVGAKCGKLSQAYQIEQHRKIARENGYEIIGERVNAANGNIELKVRM
jgi:hypothetical protein